MIAPDVTGKIRGTRALALDEFVFLQKIATTRPKITLPSPSTMHFYGTVDYGPPAVYGERVRYATQLPTPVSRPRTTPLT